MAPANIEAGEYHWKRFYKVAGSMAFLIVLVGLLDTITSVVAGKARENSTVSVVEWFVLFQTNRFSALSNLGLINIITLTLGMPVYLALYNIHRRHNPAFTTLSATLFFVGAAVYISSNAVFSMLALSNQYPNATDAQKLLLEAAGAAALAQGADLTPGTFMGLFFTQIAGIIMAFVILCSGIFNKWTAWCGLAGFGLTSLFFILAAFAPASYDLAMLFAMTGGPLLMVYHLMLTRRFFQLAR